MPALILPRLFELRPTINELVNKSNGINSSNSSIYYPLSLLIKLISIEFLTLYKATIIASPIADSAAATANIKNTKT